MMATRSFSNLSMMSRWAGRVALVTGASSGIGLELAGRLAQHGMKVVGCARNTDKIQELSTKLLSETSKGSLTAIKCDLTKKEEISTMFTTIKADLGGVDVLVNSAGVSHVAPLTSGETWKFTNMLELNVIALTICTREAIQSMRDRGVDDGHIIHVSSGGAHALCPDYDARFYYATKWAVRALTEGLHLELRSLKSRIRVSSVSPGFVETEFSIRMRGDEGRELYRTEPTLHAKDVVDAIEYQLAAPPNVQVSDILIRPTEQVNM